ncbi:MAG: zinc ribbon domain-containing protein [Candidatus Coatesbacteria bacterium]|nr:zinc ribbon domain-containing protein [Candidatus Coatesbacteria bacterium]
MTEIVSLKCPNCGADIDEGQLTCNYCNSKLKQVSGNICPKCGSEIDDKTNTCQACGFRKKLDKATVRLILIITAVIVISSTIIAIIPVIGVIIGVAASILAGILTIIGTHAP